MRSKKRSSRKDRALVAAVKLLRDLDATLEAVGAPVAACLVCEARFRIVDQYRQLFESRRTR